MKKVVAILVAVVSFAFVPSAGAFHKQYHHRCCPVHYSAAPGYGYAVPGMTFAPAGAFVAPPASYYTPAFSYVPTGSYSYAPAGSYGYAPSYNQNDPAAGIGLGSLTAILDVLDRVTTWSDKHRGGGGGASSKKVDDLARDIEEMKKTLATLKPVENLDERLKKISTDLQLHNAKFDKLDADIKAIKMKLNLP